MVDKIRCSWCNSSPLYQEYHDKEWGNPNRNGKELFELLMLEGAQAGLSWITVLKKRPAYRLLFDNFDPELIVKYDKEKVEKLVQDSRIIRHRGKISAIINNAQMYLKLSERIDFGDYLWSFVENGPVEESADHITSRESILMSKALKKEGFKFVGPTICYAFMQACGMVNDHSKDCWKYSQ